MSDEIEAGMHTEAIAELLDLSIPPQRPEGKGITMVEVMRKSEVSQTAAIKILKENNNLTPVKMRNYNGVYSHVYLPNEEAQSYQNWIIKEL